MVVALLAQVCLGGLSAWELWHTNRLLRTLLLTSSMCMLAGLLALVWFG
jgi:hypothetical protein